MVNSAPNRSFLGTVHKRFFTNRFSAIITLLSLAFTIWFVWNALSWAYFSAVFGADGLEACREETAGACWTVINVRWRIILFGLYPIEEQWRSALACGVIVVVGILSCVPAMWKPLRMSALWLVGFAIFYTLMRGGYFGLLPVFEQRWGGLSLTIFIFASVAIIGMPLSIIFALMRRSELFWISRPMALIIDTIRSLPLLSIMFTFGVVLPFALPGWLTGDKLYRVIVGYSLFFACYQAEIIRGGMQSVPAGQEEAANALGIGYWSRIFRIVLPQAFRAAAPPTVNQFVITFKETSLVAILGFFDLISSGNAAFGTAEWGFAFHEVYIFVAAIYFVFVFSLSRYGAYLENKMRVVTR